MRYRIKKIRKDLDLTQQEFADRLGIKRSTIANYEMGRNRPVDSVVALICREFNINEIWLREGIGPQFIEIPRNRQIEKYVKDMLKYESDSFKCRLIAALISLDSEDWEKLEEIIDNIQKYINKSETVLSNNRHGYIRTDEEIEKEVEDYRRELIEEKRAREKLPASQDLKEG